MSGTNPAQTATEEVKSRDERDSDETASQTAQQFLSEQLQLEAEAREVLPYQFDACTRPLGALRQTLFSCLTCNRPPSDPNDRYTAAGICYACSISCHGEHDLVELFSRRNFVCDCGTKRLPATSPCALRINADTGRKSGVHSEDAAAGNAYNHNFRNRFCDCGELYDAEKEKGTMFQCVGLGTVEEGGCGEDWWHPECLLGARRNKPDTTTTDNHIPQQSEHGKSENGAVSEADHAALPPGFPAEEDFEHIICHKCTAAFPWIKRYQNASGFLKGPTNEATASGAEEADSATQNNDQATEEQSIEQSIATSASGPAKRKLDDTAEDESVAKKVKTEENIPESKDMPGSRHSQLPVASNGPVTLFCKENFRDSFCRCPECFALLKRHPQLLEEEETYEPPLSSDTSGDAQSLQDGTGSAGSRSLYDRGEAALSNMDRVRALEGVMAYNHLRDGLKDFLKPFAESGTAVGADDIKQYFERLRGGN